MTDKRQPLFELWNCLPLAADGFGTDARVRWLRAFAAVAEVVYGPALAIEIREKQEMLALPAPAHFVQPRLSARGELTERHEAVLRAMRELHAAGEASLGPYHIADKAGVPRSGLNSALRALLDKGLVARSFPGQWHAVTAGEPERASVHNPEEEDAAPPTETSDAAMTEIATHLAEAKASAPEPPKAKLYGEHPDYSKAFASVAEPLDSALHAVKTGTAPPAPPARRLPPRDRPKVGLQPDGSYGKMTLEQTEAFILAAAMGKGLPEIRKAGGDVVPLGSVFYVRKQLWGRVEAKRKEFAKPRATTESPFKRPSNPEGHPARSDGTTAERSPAAPEDHAPGISEAAWRMLRIEAAPTLLREGRKVTKSKDGGLMLDGKETTIEAILETANRIRRSDGDDPIFWPPPEPTGEPTARDPWERT